MSLTELNDGGPIEKPKEVFNPYSDLDKFRREAFRRIPGVVNYSN